VFSTTEITSYLTLGLLMVSLNATFGFPVKTSQLYSVRIRSV